LSELLYKALHERNALQRYFARRVLFNFFQRLGFHVTGDHFYDVVPNTRLIAAEYRDDPRPLAGIDFRFSECERRLLRLLKIYGAEYAGAYETYGFRENNPYFRGMDALVLYVLLRELKPKKLVEIGRGFSTCITLSALDRNVRETGGQVEFTSIDPYARHGENHLPHGVEFRRIQQELQSVNMAPILEGCRFLFIDSSHVYKFGSDVEYEFTRIYPHLWPGTIVHLHDIFSPYHYPFAWLVQHKRFWNEQYHLETFLMFNHAFEVYLPVNLLVRQSAVLISAIETLTLDRNFQRKGASFYLHKI
jgi:hypothetical protein